MEVVDTVPPEILHMVCSELSPDDLPAFRLVSKHFASVGAEYLAPNLVCHFRESSFKAIETIASHPAIAQHVKTLTYLGGLLGKELSLDEYSPHHWWYSSGHGFRLPPMHGCEPWETGTPDKLSLRYEQKMGSCADATYPFQLEGLEQGHQTYMRLHEEQVRISRDKEDIRSFAESIPRFTNLKCLRFSLRSPVPDARSILSFRPGVRVSRPYGVPQLLSMLKPIDEAKIRLDSLYLKDIGSELLQLPEDKLAVLKRVVSSISKIALSFYVDYGPPDKTKKLHDTSTLSDILGSAQQLEHLDFVHSGAYISGSDKTCSLKQLTGEFHFSRLRRIDLSHMTSSEDDLVEFAERHRNSLRHLELNTMRLDKGSWFTTLPRLRDALAPGTTAILLGRLYVEIGSGFPEHWYLDVTRYNTSRKRNSLAMKISHYLSHPWEHAECPLVHDNMHGAVLARARARRRAQRNGQPFELEEGDEDDIYDEDSENSEGSGYDEEDDESEDDEEDDESEDDEEEEGEDSEDGGDNEENADNEGTEGLIVQ